MATIEVPLANGRGVALIDQEDAERIGRHSWHRHSGGYASSRIGGKLVLMHRLLMGEPEGLQVDHRSRDRLDNRRSNLRVVSGGDQSQNTDARPGSTSRSRGVSFCKQTGRWRAVACLHGRYHAIGRFDSEAEAAEAARAWRAEHMPLATN